MVFYNQISIIIFIIGVVMSPYKQQYNNVMKEAKSAMDRLLNIPHKQMEEVY